MYNPEFISDRSERASQPSSSAGISGFSDPDLQKIFDILDTFVPLEYCVYYQIIPLSVTNNCLNLGMVNTEDKAAIGYIQSIIAYLKYSLRPQSIEPTIHETILSAYLKHRQERENQKFLPPYPAEIANPAPSTPSIPSIEDDRDFNSRATFIAPSGIFSSSDRHSSNLANLPPQKPQPEIKTIEISPETSPQQLSKKILVKVLQGDIGRLYFERHRDCGKIICSQEGTIQYSIDRLSLDLFQGTLDEFKILVGLNERNHENIQKIEVEKTYRQEQVLLRFQIINSSHGEEGTLQVLRGKALKFYKQNKLEQIGKQALELAQKLERKLHQIDAYSGDSHSTSETVLALQTITQELSRYLERSIEP